MVREGMQMEAGGEYFISSGGTAYHQPTGTLTSAAFEVTHSYASFLVSGGARTDGYTEHTGVHPFQYSRPGATEAESQRLGIVVKNVAGYATQSVAQCTLAIILHLMQKITFYDDFVKNGEYAKSEIFTNVGWNFHEICGKRFGIIGGTIGRKVAEIVKAFRTDVIYYSTSGRNKNQSYTQVDLDELLQKSI